MLFIQEPKKVDFGGDYVVTPQGILKDICCIKPEEPSVE